MLLLVILALSVAIVWLGITGPTNTPDGSTPATGRQGKTAETIIAQTGGDDYEDASRGYIFAACDQGVGVAVTVTLTTTATLTLHNPATSKTRLEIRYIYLTYFSGTMVAGTFYHGTLGPGNTLPSSGTLLTSQCTAIGYQNVATANGVVRTAATVVAGTPLKPFLSSFPQLASTANGFQPGEFKVSGVILEPGAQYQLLGVHGGTGSTPKVGVGIQWREIAVIGG